MSSKSGDRGNRKFKKKSNDRKDQSQQVHSSPSHSPAFAPQPAPMQQLPQLSPEKEKPKEKQEKAKESREDAKDGPIICPGHSRPVPDLAFSKETSDGYFLVSSCLDGKPMIREGQTGDWIGTFTGHKGAVWCTRLNATATHALTASADFSVKLWDAVTGAESYSFTHKHIVRTCAFSEDSKWIYTGGKEKKVRVYDLNRPEADPTIFDSQGSIEHLALSPDPTVIFSSSSEEKFIRLWDLRTSKSEKQLDCLAPVASIQLSMDGGLLAAAAGHHLHFWDGKNYELAKSFKLGRPIDCAAYHASAGLFVTGSSSELWVRAYDYKTGQEAAINKGHHGPCRYLAFNPSGSSYASGSEDGTIRIWEWAKERQQRERSKSISLDDGDLDAGADKQSSES
jgi:serine-threonine kinase receptor-associated protein